MTPEQKESISKLMELLMSYRTGLGGRYAGWTQKDYRQVLGAACGVISQMDLTLARYLDLEPGEWLTRMALSVQLDDAESID